MESKKNNKRALLGLLLIVLGFILIGTNFNIFPFGLRPIIFSWQGLLILIGLFFLFSREANATGWILISIGGFFLIPHIWEVPGEWSQMFWPAVLLGLGAVLIIRSVTRKRHKPDEGPDYIDDMAVFGGGDRMITSQSFKGGRVTAIFGGGKYNLLNAQLAKGRNEIDIFAMFGGCKFIIPEDWEIRLEVSGIFGGFSDKRHIRKDIPRDPSKELVIKGVAIFGGGEVVSF
jgi:predicted membrane protein